MFRWAVILFVLAIVAALFGFGGTAGVLADGAQLLFVAFIALLIIGGVVSLFRRA
ncbi:DUF1328 domain-containing protein [Phototrophicus methaneseepsis]|uniref:DUF1328 domain-containing protein n=1 Tax=Phototrophicus methaneseepsis TaxID=2710758 RepID=A0A7S8ECC6_9CHLR|nr:DUF1328 domain-containing protein [Phototrophicus methaneseepsis]QPC84128.1 DUF1328 domain-containing protein [Phototrophicus methaneseepsis]